ncbi:MAG TPA: hypothetical protein VH008_02680 [Pseudonocardia sp.]|jgi:hypothetical protein|nr:hypothetical protein [Pseudonocardia sp.]
MTPAGPQEIVDGYLRHLRSLVWPGAADRDSADTLDELRDHLLCEVEQQVTNGVEPRSAAQQALCGFGPVDELTGKLQRELVRPHLRRLSNVLLLLGLSAGATWTGVLMAGPPEPWTDRTEPRTIVFFDYSGEIAATCTLVAAALGILLVIAPGRFLIRPQLRALCQRWSVRACATSLLLGLATAVQLAGYLAVRAVIAPASLSWTSIAVTCLLTAATVPILARPLRAVVAMRPGQPAHRVG